MRRWLVLLVTLALTAACAGDDGGDVDPAGPDGSGETVESENVLAGDADEGIDGVQSIRVGEPEHTDAEVEYGLTPPAGGAHNEVWANCGFYDEPLDDENVVHDLEHGAVWLAYSPDLDTFERKLIQAQARANPKVIAAPYPGLAKGEAVVATAWARQLRAESADDPRLVEFVAQYVDGSQAPEAGVTCGQSPLGEPIP
jgi:hypothetical protein